SVSKWPNPRAFIQAISFVTSAMTSGPMPSPGRRRSLWVGMAKTSRDGEPAICRRRELLDGDDALGKAGGWVGKGGSKIVPAPQRLGRLDPHYGTTRGKEQRPPSCPCSGRRERFQKLRRNLSIAGPIFAGASCRRSA